MKIQVEIERLILDGLDLPAGQRPLLQGALETELAQLLSTGGLNPALQEGGIMPNLRVNAISLPGRYSPQQLGQQIARSVYSGMFSTAEKSE